MGPLRRRPQDENRQVANAGIDSVVTALNSQSSVVAIFDRPVLG
jgi:hypothetical protein